MIRLPYNRVMFKNNQPMIKITDAASILHISPQTLRTWTDDGKIKATLSEGGHRQYTESDVYSLRQSLTGKMTAWFSNLTIQMDGYTEPKLYMDFGEKEFVLSEASEEIPVINSGFGRGRPLSPDMIELIKTQKPVVGLPTRGETIYNPEKAGLIMQADVFVLAFTKEECEQAMKEAIPEALAWVKANCIPVTGIAAWINPEGEAYRLL